MADDSQVSGAVPGGIIVLTLSYAHDMLLKLDAGQRLSTALLRKYRELRAQDPSKLKTTSVVVEVKSEVAGSPVVKALFELWREVVGKESGQVVCVGYPQEYLDSLTALGLTALPGFSLAGSRADALRRLGGP